MDKGYLPYLHNGKKFHTLPDGQCLYRYPKGDGLELVKVSKELPDTSVRDVRKYKIRADVFHL